ncbi:unnamed protein product (macronuclear) [Paramecium tetraurelia]|uniref:Transmembrane protein n=1 Tax=Paramecium tetraurelia TaxID=5888 RepID=A0BZH1_PARTE|nr:uncharacterized protein GSPATT00033791001 [Paramecium tetraurelia]CAK63938.1 unnamed protein product [Paramecium tetraurelia]|eukprot:XP_001431336.1 hypothetical protein (macronuclear) [Paramecium tetraurelia strain d4-2]
MRRALKKKKINDKLGKLVFNGLVRMQQIMIRNKIEPTLFNLIFAKILLFVSALQEIQLITSTEIQNQTSTQIQSSLLSIQQKFSINLIKYDQVEPLFFLLLSTQVLYLLMLAIVYVDKNEKFILVGQFFKYFQNIYHLIIFLPTLNITFNFALSLKYIELSIIGIILGLSLEIMYCFCNIQNSLIEIEGCYSSRLVNLFYLIMQLIICFVVQSQEQYLVAPILLLFSRFIMITQKMNNYQYNSWYYLQISNFIISYIIVFLIKQYCIQTSIRQKRLGEELFSKNSQTNLFKYSLFKNPELVKYFTSYSQFFTATQEQNVIKYQKHVLQNGDIPERLTILQYVFKYKKIQLYLNLINIDKTNLSILQQSTLEANLLNVIQYCDGLIKSPLNVNLYIKTLLLEQQNYQLLINFIDIKSQFYLLLKKEQSLDQYLNTFRIQLDKILSTLEKYKNIFERQYDLESGRLLEFQNSDQISINIVSSFLFIFYSNYFKVKDLWKKQNDLLAYDRIMNTKFQKNEAFLLSSSFIMNSNNIINKNNKRLLQIIGDQLEPKQLVDLLPQFQKTVYNSFVNQYLYQGLDINQPLTLYFYKDEYLVECSLYIYVTISKDDIILQNLIVIKNQPNHFALFDSEGKMLGISQQIYEFFTSKSDNAFTKKLGVSEFIQSGMIQYYLPEIYSHIQELATQYSLGTFQQSVNIASRWQFPVNHKKCLDQTQALGLVNDEATISSKFKKIFYSSSTKRLPSSKQPKLTDEVPTIKDTKIKIMQMQIMNQIQALVVPPSRMKSIDFEGSLEFVQQKFIESDTTYFVLKFKQIEEFQQQKIVQIPQIEDIQNISLITDESQFEGLQSDYEFISNLIKSKKLYTPLKYNIWILLLMICVTTISLLVSYLLNYYNMIHQQYDVNFLNTPQAMTFNIGASFMLMWNQYCIENQLYRISPYLEFRRENQLIYVFDFWGSVHEEYTMNLSKKSTQLGMDTIDLISYQNGQKTQSSLDYYQFYTILREALVRQFKKTDFKNITTFDPDILKTDGLIRQNMLNIFKFHNFVLDDMISSTEQSFSQFENQTFIFCVYSSIVILFLLIIFFIINCRLLRTETKLIRLLQYLNIKIIQEQIEILHFQKDQLSKLLLIQSQSKEEPVTQKPSEKAIANQPKFNPLSKLENYNEKYTLLIILSLIIGCELILFIFGSQLISKLYNSQYQSSLILTMKYLKLKSRLDSAVIVGEVMKTEHIIKNNSAIDYINQTDHIEFFFNNIDVLLHLSDQINNELVTTTSYNQSFQQQLIDIFNDDLCTYYASILSFCQISNIKQLYFENENYLTLIDKGIYGIIQDLNKLSKEEFNFEKVNLRYEYDQSHSDQFLQSSLHFHLFLQYFIELQTCIYFCFLDIFTETQILSNKLSNQILTYLITSSVAFLIFTSFVSAFWINKQYNRLNQLKLIATLFPPALIHQKGFNKLLYSQLIQIK